MYELKPTQGIGGWTYNMYIGLLAWDKDKIINFLQITTGKKLQKLEKADNVGTFDAIVILQQPRELLKQVLDFFMDETVVWDEKANAFNTLSHDNEIIGKIDRNNFEDVRDMMLQMNYINLGDKAKPIKHSNDKARELWEKAQKYLQRESKKETKDKNMNLGNIISKLSIASPSYNLLNIYNLTIFQLYDQFFQCGYLRAMDLKERVFSIHGGDDFSLEDWLKPIINIKGE